MNRCKTVKDKLLELLSDKKLLHKPGGVLYSSYHTVKPGDFMIFGLNPGGDPEKLKETIKNDIEKKYEYCKCNIKWNEFFDECWDGKPGESKLQARIRYFAKLFWEDEEKLRDVCATNLFFVRSKSIKQINSEFEKYAKDCWKVNEYLISEVKPKYIIVYSNKAYDYLKCKLGVSDEELVIDAKWTQDVRNRRYVRIAQSKKGSKLIEKPFYIINIPHLSIYTFKGREYVVDEIKDRIGFSNVH
jgi:hypothetical protein